MRKGDATDPKGLLHILFNMEFINSQIVIQLSLLFNQFLKIKS